MIDKFFFLKKKEKTEKKRRLTNRLGGFRGQAVMFVNLFFRAAATFDLHIVVWLG